MFKLAWRESLMDMWRRVKEYKVSYVLEILAVFFYYLLLEGEISYSMLWMMSEVENFGLTASGAWMKYRLELLIFCGFLLYVAISIVISVCYIRASMRRLEV